MSGKEILVPAKEGKGFIVRRGQTIRVVDVEGHQIADFICFNQHLPKEKLSTGDTVVFNAQTSFYPTVGARFYSNLQNPMFEIVEDMAKGSHDVFFAPCSSQVYANVDDPTHPNCRDNLSRAVEPYGLGITDVPDTINLFQYSRPQPDGTFDWRPAPTLAGEYVALQALMDCIVAVSACPFDLDEYIGSDGKREKIPKLNGDGCTPIKIEFA